VPDRRLSTATPARYNGLVASAAVVKAPNQALRKVSVKGQPWQKKAWQYFDEIGELRFGAGWVGNGMSRINLVAASVPVTQGDEPTPIGEIPEPGTPEAEEVRSRVQQRALELMDDVAGGPTGQGALLQSLGTHFTVAGESWIVAEPDLLRPDSDTYESWLVVSDQDFRVKKGLEDSFEVADDLKSSSRRRRFRPGPHPATTPSKTSNSTRTTASSSP
jgi:hypothetical protein